MISGLRLKEALIFQKSYIENMLWKTASKMVQLERNLNVLRVGEIISWHQACEGKLNDARGSIRRVGELVDAKLDRVATALETIRECDGLLSEVGQTRKTTEESVMRMKRELNERTRIGLEKAKASPEVVEMKTALRELDEQLKQTSEGYARAREDYPSIMVRFERDPAFQYLHGRGYGTSSYQANALVAKLDSWLADRIDFERATRIYESAVVIDESMDRFLAAYAQKREELQNNLSDFELKIQQELDDMRLEFSELVNSIQDYDRQAKRIRQRMSDAKNFVQCLIKGDDADFQAASEELLRLLVREKAAASVRLSRSQNPENLAQRDKAVSLGKDRLTMSVDADSTRQLAYHQVQRVMAIDELLRRLEARQWLTEGTFFDLDERSQFFIDIIFQKADVEHGWKQLKQAYLPGEAIDEIQEQELAFIG